MKHNKFAKIIEMILVSLPLFYVGGVGAYTIFNKNAKDSYYGETINQSELVDITTFDLNNDYLFVSDEFTTDTQYYLDYEFNYLVETTLPQDRVDLIVNCNRIYFRNNGRDFVFYQDNTYKTEFSVPSYSLIMGIKVLSYSGNLSFYQQLFKNVVYNKYSFLDNALPYAMGEFNKLGFGKIDFVSWFVNIFMIGQTNNVYVQFINSYLNYFIFAEVCYFIPMIFYWFIHFGEHIVDKFARKDY